MYWFYQLQHCYICTQFFIRKVRVESNLVLTQNLLVIIEIYVLSKDAQGQHFDCGQKKATLTARYRVPMEHHGKYYEVLGRITWTQRLVLQAQNLQTHLFHLPHIAPRTA